MRTAALPYGKRGSVRLGQHNLLKGTIMAITKAQQAERTEAIARLKAAIKPGETIYTTLKHVSASGMSRAISVHHVDANGDIETLDWLIARAGLYTMHRKFDGLNVGGCGMDMGFAVVYDLSRAIFADGFKCSGHDGSKRAKRCPSNDHSNDRTPDYRRGRKHSDGGYALKQQWI